MRVVRSSFLKIDFDLDELSRLVADALGVAYRLSELSLSRQTRRRLWAVVRRMLASVPWPREELALMTNVWRLRFAAYCIRKHPDALWVGFDAARRDRRICEINDLIEEART